MPVKVRCRACEHQFSVSDAARGKSVKCKECGEPVKVPAGDSAPTKKAAKPKKSIEDDDFFSSLDLDDVEHEHKRICPKCTQDVDDEDIECPHCGVNLETGMLSEKQKVKQKLKRRGPDPDEFYKVLWKNSFEFLKLNFKLVTRLAIFWAIATTIMSCCYLLTGYCEKIPLKVFFGTITLISELASIGCFVQLAVAVIKATMEQKTDVGRFQFDFFEDIAWGLKMVLWPFSLWGIILLPFVYILIPLAIFSIFAIDTLPGLIIAIPFIVVIGLAMPALPVALCHVSAKYTYKAYLPNEMIRITFRNIKPVAYWWGLTIVIAIPALIIAIPCAIFGAVIYAAFMKFLFWLLALCTIATEPDKRDWLFYVAFAGSLFGFVMIINFIYGFVISTAGVFIMRATGLFSYYIQTTLQMGDKRVAGEPAGFWIRYLAYMVDQIVLMVFLGFANLMLLLGLMLMIEIGLEGFESTIASLGKLVNFGIPFAYYVLSESGPGAGTLGKGGLGLQVVTSEGKKPITRGQAIGRYFGRAFSFAFLGIPLVRAYWDSKKETIHDARTKTKVVWKPENY